MNRKRARKIAQMKAPDIEEMKAMREYTTRLRYAELVLAAVVHQQGGKIVLAQNSLVAASGINVQRTPNGGLVLTTAPSPRPSAAMVEVQDPAPAEVPA